MADIFTRIQDASDQEVRTVLARLCILDNGTQKKALQLLNMVQEVSNAQKTAGLPHTTFYICLNCGEAYNEDENGPVELNCNYHPGESSLNKVGSIRAGTAC